MPSVWLTIILSATIKGTLTGLIIGFISKKVEGVTKNILWGGLVGLILSVLAVEKFLMIRGIIKPTKEALADRQDMITYNLVNKSSYLNEGKPFDTNVPD